MKKNLIILLAIIATLLAYSCSKDEVDDHTITDPDEQLNGTLRLKGEVTVSAPFQTKAALVPTMEGTSEVLSFQWEEGDKIQLGFVQEGKEPQITVATINDITADSRSANFNVALPEEIDGNFTLYAYYGAGSLDKNNPANINLPDAEEFAGGLNNQVRLLSMWDKKDVVYNAVALPELFINFKHLGSIISLHVENIGIESFNDVAHIELDGTYNWLMNETSRALFDMSSGTFVPNSEDNFGEGSNMSIRISESIDVGEIKTFYRWFVPGDFEAGLQLGLLAKNAVMGHRGQSDIKITPQESYITGYNYGLHITMNGYRMNFAGVIPKTIITTNTPIGESIRMRMGAADEYKSDVWIDLNNNGIRDNGEDPIEFGTVDKNYTIESQTITIHGNLSRLEITNSKLTDVDISSNPFYETINFSANELTNIDLSYNTNLKMINVHTNPLTKLDVTNNIKLEQLYAQTTQLSSLDVSNNPELRYLNLQSSQFSSAEEINSIYTQLPDRTGLSTGNMYIRYGGNSGAATANHSIAENKNWNVIYK